jgi:hypothetical protein
MLLIMGQFLFRLAALLYVALAAIVALFSVTPLLGDRADGNYSGSWSLVVLAVTGLSLPATAVFLYRGIRGAQPPTRGARRGLGLSVAVAWCAWTAAAFLAALTQPPITMHPGPGGAGSTGGIKFQEMPSDANSASRR